MASTDTGTLTLTNTATGTITGTGSLTGTGVYAPTSTVTNAGTISGIGAGAGEFGSGHLCQHRHHRDQYGHNLRDRADAEASASMLPVLRRL